MPQTPPDTRPLHVYAPTLHRDLAPEPIPPSVYFLFPGLPGAAPRRAFVPRNLPLNPAEAASALAELLRLGETLDVAAYSPPLAGVSAGGHGLAPGEKEALHALAATGKNGQALSKRPDNQLIGAHKVLLLAWDLEERLKELALLREQVSTAAKPLEESLRDPSATLAEAFARKKTGDQAPACAAPDSPGHDAIRALLDLPDVVVDEPDWRVTLAAMAAFLPRNAVIVTARADMYAAMRDAGMLHPLPEDAAEQLVAWPERLKSVCLWANAVPLWRLTGHTRPQELAPWLDMAPEIVVCPPDKLAGLPHEA